MVVLLVTPPPVPVTVTVYVPRETPEGTVMVSVLVNVGFPLDGLKLNERPLGEDEAESVTVVEEPLTSVTVIVEVLLAPRHIERLLGLADIEKSNGAFTVNV